MAEVNPRAGKIADPSTLANIPRLVTAYFTATGRVRHFGASGLRLQQRVQRGAYPGDQPGGLRSQARRRHFRPAVYWHRHPRTGGAGIGEDRLPSLVRKPAGARVESGDGTLISSAVFDVG